jgi:hypothetical protein
VRLDHDGNIKKVKEDNLRVACPPGWEEHFDASANKYYYRNIETGNIQWDHPVLKQEKKNEPAMNKVVESEDQPEEYGKDKTVQEQLHEVGFGDAPEGPKAMTKKHSKKQLKQLSAEFLKGKLQELEAKVTPRLVERDPAESIQQLGKKLEAAVPAIKEGARAPALLKQAVEACIDACHVVIDMTSRMQKSKIFLQELDKFLNTLIELQEPADLIWAAEWIHGLLKTM